LIAIIHVDDHLVVVNKPSGLLSVPGRGPDKQDCVWHRVQAQFPDALVVHRLDQATSGLLVLARGIEAQRRLSRAFAQRQVDKRYLAWVTGVPQDRCVAMPAPSGDADESNRAPSSMLTHTHSPFQLPPHTDTNPLALSSSDNEIPAPRPGWNRIDLPILPDWPNRPMQIISPEGRPCLTDWRQLEHPTSPDRTLLELQPHTGRSHQLRVHLQAIGHPILGDALYGSPTAPPSPALQLHAWQLTLPHPVEDRILTLQAPLPPHWGQISP
jgi:tRNA pseudouridine32 synthase/23S rRNA pseudouridine746 synthase